MKKLAILFSGEGTNMQTLIKKLHKKNFGKFDVEVVLAITNNPNAKGIQKARELGVDVKVLDHRDYPSREDYDKSLVKLIVSKDVDLTILAGFMRILTPIFTDNVKAINIHPSLLPDFKGANALKRSFDSKNSIVGVTTHLVSRELDGGKIIDQKSFDKTGLSYEEFEEKIHQCEYEIFYSSVLTLLHSS